MNPNLTGDKPQTTQYPRWMFVVFPAVAMMLGWGLRGHIGGGPFGAMIPGAMVALSISLLLELPLAATSLLVVLGVFGIGLGGEMTYGQTLGFLRNPETVWWGTTGTTLKGAVWGLLGGAVFSIGFFFRRIPKKTMILTFLLMMIGMYIGFKLINDPMIIYFSDPANPRPESWGALLVGAIVLLLYLKFKLKKPDFKIIYRFAILGMIGGGLGFGLGGFWMVMGSNMPDVIFKSWWKAMEFTFGFLLGGSLGYAAWLSRNELKAIADKDWKIPDAPFQSVYVELGLTLLAGIITYWLIPKSLEPFVEGVNDNDGFMLSALRDISRLLVNYAFYGFLFVLMIIKFPKIAWQIGITLTFCHASIDLIRDFFPDTNTSSPFTMHFLIVFLMTAFVALLVAYFSKKQNSVSNLFLLLIWSCILVSFLRMAINTEKLSIEGLSLCQIVFGRFIVDIFFAVSAIIVSWMILQKFQSVKHEKQRIAETN
jgi:hypothetical protein